METNEEFTPYAWEVLRQHWEREEITHEQFSGQLLVWLRQLYEMLVIYRREQEMLTRAQIALDARLAQLEEDA